MVFEEIGKEEFVICPLMTAGVLADTSVLLEEDGNFRGDRFRKATECKQHECAWWNASAEKCAALVLAGEAQNQCITYIMHYLHTETE